jgi:hypothetical protein
LIKRAISLIALVSAGPWIALYPFGVRRGSGIRRELRWPVK